MATTDIPASGKRSVQTGEAFAVTIDVLEGKSLYRAGALGKSLLTDAQYWATISPAEPFYAMRNGIPPKNMLKVNFVEVAIIKPGSPFIVRPAPGVGANLGGALEVVTVANGAEVVMFITRKAP